MKKLFAFALVSAMGVWAMQAADERVLLTIDGEPSTVEEFLYIYQKNNQESQIDHKSISEYLDLFINFKLKVHEAEQLGLDTTAAFKKELAGYRNQATPKYMVDKEAEEAAVQKVYGRMLWDVKVSHIAVRCPQGSSAEDEQAALEKINRARTRVTTGLPVTVGKGKRAKVKPGVVEDFNIVAAEMSEDPSVANNMGRIGWVTPFRFVFPFEEAAYNTAVDSISEVFRTPFGYHILKVEELASHREIHAAHIMKMTPRDNAEVSARAKAQIDSLYQVVTGGTNFAVTAMSNSDDRGSAMRGGDLSWFSRGQMVPEFENVAFAMARDSSISEPVKSMYGWHIIQFLGAKGTPDLADIREDVLKKIRQSEYRLEIEDAFVEKLKKEYAFTEDTRLLEPFVELAAGHAVQDSAFQAATEPLTGVLFSIGNKAYTQGDFARYLKENFFSQKTTAKELIEEKYHYFVARELRATENANLENKYPELRNLMQEYHDGILLFEVSLQKVWDKASLDTVGITQFFKQHKKEYTWEKPRYKGYVVYCKDKASAKAAKQIIKSAHPDSVASYIDQRVNIDSTKYVQFEKGLWEKGQNGAVDKYGFKDKNAEVTVPEELMEVFNPIVFTVGKVLKAPEEYTDERGKVTAAYQDYLEQEWIRELRAKYKVEVNQEVLNSLQ